MGPWKYLLALSIPLSVAVAFTQQGLWTFFPLFYAFVAIPLVELFTGPDPRNQAAVERELAGKDRRYDFLLYAILPLMLVYIFWFAQIWPQSPDRLSAMGRITALGLMCGVFGINVGHELGHRRRLWEQRWAQMLLGTSLYAHFFIEHNYGHHRNVATPEDPATARRNEPVYFFWWRSVIGSYRHAWQIQAQLLKARKAGFWSGHNQMLLFQLGQALWLLALWFLFGPAVLWAYVAAAVFGILLLETVNYIEHYGLLRGKESERRYENTNPRHSWNSDHPVGRLLLFELSRHSDHHAHPHKAYQVLSHFDESPQLPTGYPGMMLLSLVPPLYFSVMNPRIDQTGQGRLDLA